MSGMIFDGAVPGRQGRVMVVEDEAYVRRPICMALGKAGYEVVEAGDGAEAITKLNEGDNPLAVDTILCDIKMPTMSGPEAIAYFRKQFPTVPIVVLTGYPDVHLATSLMKQGVKNYLVKPITKDELVAAVNEAVDQHVILDNQFVA